ncbi:hypothetical protein PLESTB_000499900 [Pleodorina starrii]|uniref:PH domain-containing protein n=1 Tax=Pleodorina starrii TaxID=330485 RepID=A0A9W6BFS0_9CHLO|nr:hypothetical protein PLESTM_000371300 [Pleodorina starrii]GLC51416.1 hypothetical protein PLESTB_000499900 [Pleodorina starrii]GLC63781.1 hypothetical protein PLESTF_000073400 [Pleodorina starrii]
MELANGPEGLEAAAATGGRTSGEETPPRFSPLLADVAARTAGRSPPIAIKQGSLQNSNFDLGHDLEELDANVLAEMLLKASPKFTAPFAISQITRNVSVGRAARREMDVASHGGLSESYASAAAAIVAAGATSEDGQSLGGRSSGGGASAVGLPNGHGHSNGQVLGSGPSGPLLLPPGLSMSSQLLASVSSIGTFDAEIARQRAALAAIEDDVEEESRVNRELAGRVTERLENSCRILEGLAALLTALGQAEAAYATAMAAASRVRLLGLEADDGELRAAGEALMRVPSVVDQAHRPLHATLTGMAKDVTALLSCYRAAAREVSTEAATAHRNIDAARRQLAGALGDHVTACRAFEAVLAERQRRQPTRGPEEDPWATERRLVQEQQSLQRWQDRERALLKTGFQRVTELEQQRLELSKQAMTVAVDSYRAALLPLQTDLESMTAVLRAIQPEVKLSMLRDVAATATRTAEGLAARQTECLHSVCHELFCSPEIVRQGDLQVLEPATERWRKCHFVLTRAGYLHWFTRAEEVRPLDSLALGRSTFEAGTAPRFNILEVPKGTSWLGGIRGRRLMFQAASVEECCEWAIAIREAIAVAAGKQLAFEEEGAA